MIALHAGVMYCTEITDALWKRYLSQHPENLIDEDSVLINFARTQSIRRRIGCSASSTSLAPNHNGSSGGSAGRRVIQRNAHARLSRFLSYRQVPAAVRNTRGAVVYRPNPRGTAPSNTTTSSGTTDILIKLKLYRPSSRQDEALSKLNRPHHRRQSSTESSPQTDRPLRHSNIHSDDLDDSLCSSESLSHEHSSSKLTKAIGVVKSPLKKLRSAMLPSSSVKSSAKNSTASDLLPNSDRLSLTRCATSLARPTGNYQEHSTTPSTTSSNHNRKISFSLLDTHEEGKETVNKSAIELAAIDINRAKKKS
uniref:DUSP domain-containing protein n=1 Tax=Meloidogyne hapla TaxID=6305 RepID=A0A1I8B9V4_MELHA